MATDGGIGTYLQNLVPRIAAARPSWRFTAMGDSDEMARLGWSAVPNIRLARCVSRYYTVTEQIEVPLRCPADADVFWAPHYNVPLFMRRPVMTTVHDVCHLALPEGFLRRSYARFMFARVARTARSVLFDSEFSRSEMDRLSLSPRGATAVGHAGVDISWFSASNTHAERPFGDPYLLYVGNLKRHKNVPLLLRAFGSVRDAIPHRLVLVGRREGLRADPAVDAEAAKLGDRVVFAGEVDSARLKQLVVHADALVTASLYEGFGLPPLEAMAAGCPCLVSQAGSLPEVCGDAALYCDPRNERSVAAGLVKIATDGELRAALVQRGRERAREFTWEKCATVTLDMLERALT